MISKKSPFCPKASVILPIFNAGQYLVPAVRSILEQTFTDFECLLLNDGSTDSSAAILENFAKIDPRCKVFSWPNQGIVKTLNRGIELATTDIIFRMDADDISRSQRFEKQFEYLVSHPDCVALGTRILMIDDNGSPIREFIDAFDHSDIDAAHIAGLGSSIAHPSVVMRKSALTKIEGYREEFTRAQDVDLFLRLAEVGKLANLQEVLLDYRVHANSVSFRNAAEQSAAARKAVTEARVRRAIEPSLFPNDELVDQNDFSPSALHRRWAWWALGASNIRTARKHTWKAFSANPFELANIKLAACVLRGY